MNPDKSISSILVEYDGMTGGYTMRVTFSDDSTELTAPCYLQGVQ